MTKIKTAVIGTGISGLSAAYCLSKTDDITVFEKKDYAGGHARTVSADVDGRNVAVDTGFIVFNKENYPNFLKMITHLSVPFVKSNMSFGASVNHGAIEYCSHHIFAQKRNIFRLSFWRMLFDIVKFNKKSHAYLKGEDHDMTLGQYLDEINMGAWFRKYYLQAMGAAIWSSSTDFICQYPARTFLQFFYNHGLLRTDNHLQWYTIEGGSKNYVARLTDGIKDRIKFNCGVASVTRKNGRVMITDEHGQIYEFDRVVFGSHADQTVRMISDLSDQEREILSAFQYQKNETVLHSDLDFMPRRKKAWASWVYLTDQKQERDHVSLSYWMNNLQPLDTDRAILNTMNPTTQPKDNTVYDRYRFSHPLFNNQTDRNQKRIKEIQGAGNYWYCGAWQGYGFHEDGLKSAVDMLRVMGEKIPWE